MTARSADSHHLVADLVLEGGGVKGSALIGAVAAFEDAGYRFHRLAGTSMGALIASAVAAGIRPARMRELMMSVDFARLLDATRVRSLHLGALGTALSEMLEAGIYRGDALREAIAGWLGEAGVRTFADLRLDDPGADRNLPPDRRYRLVMVASDVSRELMVRIPWDLRREYGLDPDSFAVADAVRASTAIPFFFRPARLRSNLSGQDSYVVDGALTSGFPVHIFDRTDGLPPRFPTFHVSLTTARAPTQRANDVAGDVDLLRALVHTALNGRLNSERSDPAVAARTVVVDTSYVGATDFSINAATRQRLYDDGYAAAQEFLVRGRFVP
jgi:NTE family protein